MEIKELRKNSEEKLIKLKKQLEISLARAKCDWSSKEEKLMKKKIAKAGDNKKQIQQIRRTIAQINTILQQRDSEELCKNKPRSKRRERRLRGKQNDKNN